MLKKIVLAVLLVCVVRLEALPYDPLAVYLTWQRSPETTMTVQWISHRSQRRNDVVEYQRVGECVWKAAQGRHLPMPGKYPFVIHHTEITELIPDTEYRFRTGEDAVAYKFRTMPSKMTTPIRFIVGGDIYHDGLAVLEKMNRQVAQMNPLFILCGGDLVYNEKLGVYPDLMPRWLDWLIAWKKQMVAPDGRLIPMIPIIGNHEVEKKRGGKPADAPFFYSLFAMPGMQGYNTLDFGDYLSFILLDSGHTHPVRGKQTQWLQDALQNRQSVPYKFAMYHVAAYPSYRKFNEPVNEEIRKYWIPLFEKFDVKNVFENHDHAYKRTHPIKSGQVHPKGIVYVGDGGWAVEHPRIPKSPKTTWYLAKTLSSRNVVMVILHDDIRHFLAIDDDGKIIDEFVGK